MMNGKKNENDEEVGNGNRMMRLFASLVPFFVLSLSSTTGPIRPPRRTRLEGQSS